MTKKYLTPIVSIILTLILTGAGCESVVKNDKSANNIDEIKSEISTEATKIQIETTESKTGQVAKQPAPVIYESQLREFTINAKNWEFSPSTIIVNQGDKVKIKITSTDVTHSFILKDYDINVKLEPNQTKIIEFIASKYGVFQFRCGVPCGEGHLDMVGTLVIK